MKTTVKNQAIVVGKDIKGKKKRGAVKEVKRSRVKMVYKEQAEACTKPECSQSCAEKSFCDLIVEDNRRMESALRVQEVLSDKLARGVRGAVIRIDDVTNILNVFCASNLGFDLEQFYKTCEGSGYQGLLSPQVSQKQVCAEAVARLAVMIYASLLRPDPSLVKS